MWSEKEVVEKAAWEFEEVRGLPTCAWEIVHIILQFCSIDRENAVCCGGSVGGVCMGAV